MRLVIAGVPKAGKTTLSMQCGTATPGPVWHTDDLFLHGWSEASAEASEWFDEPGPWIVEGVAAGRALRKWMRAHPEGKPCDRVIWMGTPRLVLVGGQLTMAKGCWTVWLEIRDALAERGTIIDVHT